MRCSRKEKVDDGEWISGSWGRGYISLSHSTRDSRHISRWHHDSSNLSKNFFEPFSSIRPKPKLPTDYFSRNIQQVLLYPQCDIIICSALPVQGNASGEVCQTREKKLDTVIAGKMGRIATWEGESPQLLLWKVFRRRCGSVFADPSKLVLEPHLTGGFCAAGKQPKQTAATISLNCM